MVSSKDSEWGGDYWLAHCIEGKKTLIMSMTDDENNHFPIGSMVVKGESLHMKTMKEIRVDMFTGITNHVQVCIILPT